MTCISFATARCGDDEARVIIGLLAAGDLEDCKPPNPRPGTGESPELIKPGMIFIADHGKGKGHTALVESVQGGPIKTIEGNTDASQTREGGGVYRLTRKIVDMNKGFIVYG